MPWLRSADPLDKRSAVKDDRQQKEVTMLRNMIRFCRTPCDNKTLMASIALEPVASCRQPRSGRVLTIGSINKQCRFLTSIGSWS